MLARPLLFTDHVDEGEHGGEHEGKSDGVEGEDSEASNTNSGKRNPLLDEITLRGAPQGKNNGGTKE